MMIANEQDELRQLLRLLREGEQFYFEASRRAELQAHRELFKEMSLAKASMSSALAAKLTFGDSGASNDDTWIDNVRQCYANCRARMASDRDARFIRDLEAAEDRILDGFRDALGTISDPAIRRAVETRFPHAMQVHERMAQQMHRPHATTAH